MRTAESAFYLPCGFSSGTPETNLNICLSAAKAPRKTRGELAKKVDADYYGYRDEEDGIIVPLEQEEEKKGMM